MKRFGAFVIIIVGLSLIACIREDTSLSYNRIVTITAGFDTGITKVSLSHSAQSKDMIARWQNGDEVKVLIYGDEDYLELPSIAVRDISSDGKSCHFSYSIPDNYPITGNTYTLVCYTISPGSDDLEKPKTRKETATLEWPLLRHPIEQFRAPVYFQGKVTEDNTVISFQHLYAYEILHITNETNQAINFSLRGFNAETTWFRLSSSINLPIENTYSWSTGNLGKVVDESPGQTINPHTEDIIVSAYIPNGQSINNAQMVAEINGEVVYSANTKSSSATLQTGHAYHMYATWDGKELRFDEQSGAVELSTNEIDFGKVEYGTDKTERFTVSNTGKGKLAFSISCECHDNVFEVDGGEEQTLAPGASKEFTVTAHGMKRGSHARCEIRLLGAVDGGLQTVLVKAEGWDNNPLTLDCSYIKLPVNSTEDVPILFGSMNYELSNGNPDVVRASIGTKSSGGGGRYDNWQSTYQYVRLEGIRKGTATLVITDKERNETCTLNVTVTDDDSTEVFTVNGVTFTMVTVNGGSFMMGSPDDDPDAGGIYSDEKPQHKVSLDTYAIGMTEVTQALWKAVMGNNPSIYVGDDLPVEEVSWDECQAFVTKLSSLTGRIFRLPTEAEWEYAARGGEHSQGYKFSGSDDVNSVSWNCDNCGGITHSVGTKNPNELGLYDMTGNVWEWCQDWYGHDYYKDSPEMNPCNNTVSSYHIHRGGSIEYIIKDLRVAMRGDYYNPPSDRLRGLRLALSPGNMEQMDWVDLGLPSGTKWATCNLGATKPEEYGDYYAWGETEPYYISLDPLIWKDGKSDGYIWAYYKWGRFSFTKYSTEANYWGGTGSPDNKTVLDLEDDAAHVRLGGKWRMPTETECSELREKCTLEKTMKNAVYGYSITGPNGHSIFLPAAGFWSETILFDWGSSGTYWSSSLDTDNGSKYARCMDFDTSGVNLNFGSRSLGLSVRPVYDDSE